MYPFKKRKNTVFPEVFLLVLFFFQKEKNIKGGPP